MLQSYDQCSRLTLHARPLSLDMLSLDTGKHSMKKEDYLVPMMQVPPKQRNDIRPFDLRTQREAFSVSLEGLKGVRLGHAWPFHTITNAIIF